MELSGSPKKSFLGCGAVNRERKMLQTSEQIRLTRRSGSEDHCDIHFTMGA